MPYKLLILLFFIIQSPSNACEFVMGYRTSERLPLINKAPDHQGLYYSLYKAATEEIGCSLAIVRAPKKRILKMLETGKIDFYPGLGYSEERAKYIHYFKNGLTSHTVALSHPSLPDIQHLADMRGKVLLMAIGANKFNLERYGILIRQAHDLSIASAIKMLEQQRVDFFLHNLDTVNYFLKSNPEFNVKLHSCCFKEEAMYLGFAKKSKHLKLVTNVNYVDALGSAKNQPEKLVTTSKAYQLQQALEQLKISGKINQLKTAFYQ